VRVFKNTWFARFADREGITDGELNLMYVNLKTKNLGGFGSGMYWSSSRNSSGFMMGQDFSDGIRSVGGWASTYSVRAVRSF